MGYTARRIGRWLGTALCAICLSSAAFAETWQVKGQFGWLGVGTAHPITEGHFYWVGEFSGTFFNDAGPGGAMHYSAVKCPGYYDLDFANKKGVAGGYCIVSDHDGDQARLSWTCQGDTRTCNGTFDWLGGTGKYDKISGTNTFTAVTEVNHPDGKVSGYAIWNR